MQLLTTLNAALLGGFIFVSGCGGGSSGDNGAPQPARTSHPPEPALPPSTTVPPEPENETPIVANPNPNPRGTGGHWFSYDFSQGGTTFEDPDGGDLTYSVYVHRDQGAMIVSGTTISGTLPPEGWIDVNVWAEDNAGASVSDRFTIVIEPNAAPEVVNPNLAFMTTPGAHINYDPTQGGTTFADADGDSLSYSLALISPARGLVVNGTRVYGALQEVGLVTFELTARDDYGGSGTDRFSIAIAAPAPGEPNLPADSYVYADEELPLPPAFRHSSESVIPFWDTQPPDNRTSNAGATLGRVLFYERRLSLTNTHACGSCHLQAAGFSVPERFSVGVQGTPMKRNAMALANVRYNIDKRWFSDLRARSLEELTLMPIQEPTELGNFLPLLEEKLAATRYYPPLFDAAFGTPEVTNERIAKALAQFLRSLISYRSKYDLAFYDGTQNPEPDPGAGFTTAEARGNEIFRSNPGALCSICHHHDVQMMAGAGNNGLDAVPTDLGAGGGTFRAPSLRNIAVTGPYMHDGRFETLREVINHYDHGVVDSPGLPALLREGSSGPPKRLNLSEADKVALEAFLHTLTDHEFLSDPKFSDPF